jgi:Fe-S-cluster containining protein
VADDQPSYDDLKLHLHVLGEDHEISARARVGRAGVMELLPLARQISEGVSRIALDHARSGGESITCKAGCAACCRMLIPIAPAEAVRLAEVVAEMPEERRRAVEERFERAVKRMEQIGLLDPRAPRGRSALLSARAAKEGAAAAWEDVSKRYFQAQIACPFLEDEACGVYPERPMICREYHVTTPASMCEKMSAGARSTPRPVRMSEVMADAGNRLLGRADCSVPLPLSLEWAKAHKAAFDREDDGEAMAMTLVQCIEDADP